MKVKKKAYNLLLILTIVFTLAAILTVLPSEHVNKVSILGYKASCSYAPISTVICLLLAGLTCKIRKSRFVEIRKG